MKDQHRKITGYRDLSQSEIDDMNRIKRLGSDLGELINDIEKKNGIDRRWLNIAKTDLQKGMMSLTRAVARPGGF